ncbi:hypothetical protein B0T21DRAFT_347240 [Apiosordaria backusii]|uniref:Uncharacterized protein n=1 Tax=Apiosordaria backusii TaxID=314023 RepID=A0AA40EEC9_9PEZI|nr:hypothetical protein B0T21DRAFT_347240 [Apiosordaria backusii]
MVGCHCKNGVGIAPSALLPDGIEFDVCTRRDLSVTAAPQSPTRGELEARPVRAIYNHGIKSLVTEACWIRTLLSLQQLPVISRACRHPAIIACRDALPFLGIARVNDKHLTTTRLNMTSFIAKKLPKAITSWAPRVSSASSLSNGFQPCRSIEPTSLSAGFKLKGIFNDIKDVKF